jgi:hypothetical protein
LYFKEYVTYYTNASFILSKKYSFKDGLFSGYNKATKSYDKSQWAIEKDENGVPKKDYNLKHERCVFQQLKKHFSRYTPDKVSQITGTPKEDLQDLRGHWPKGQGRDHHVRHGLDPAHCGGTEHQDHGHHPVVVGQHGSCRRRGQRPEG